MTVRSVFIVLVAAVTGFAAGWFAHGGQEKTTFNRDSNRRGLEYVGARAPVWARASRCRPATADEERQHRVALEVLQVFDADWVNALQRGAIKHFAYSWAQRRGASPGGDKSLPCPPVELYDAVTKAAINANVFGRPFLFEDPIRLAEQLGPRDPQIVDAIARTAFNESLIPADMFRADLRPYARLVLAEFGPYASKWAKQAMAQVSADNQLGTGAAQIAVAGGEVRALPEVKRLMTEILVTTSADKPIPFVSRNRVYELAYALGMAGQDAQSYSEPLINLLDRKVESWAPPFGMLHVSPIPMCVVAEHIGGSAASTARSKPFCMGR